VACITQPRLPSRRAESAQFSGALYTKVEEGCGVPYAAPPLVLLRRIGSMAGDAPHTSRAEAMVYAASLPVSATPCRSLRALHA